MVTIEIDGKKLEVEPGSMIIEAADNAGVYIPRFCYHKKLSIAANCRMCLVEVEKSRKPLPACATPVTDGMRVFTKSAEAITSQKAVMEFLLINHPLDCPICDQGGECELQDLAMGYGRDSSLFGERKRSVHDEDIGPLIATEMTRCIHCTRCVRFGQEIAGVRELGVTNRGEHSEITTYVKHTLQSELSGNIIDLCPVGALTSKPYRFHARSWEMEQTPAIAPHDCIGSNINVHTRRGKVLRVAPRDNESINESWISDRDRFSYVGLSHPDRLKGPMLKIDGQWQQTDWTHAFDYTLEALQKVLNKESVEQLGALASPNATTEELYLLQKIMAALGNQNIDHRIQQTDFSDQQEQDLFPGLSISIEDIENQDRILLIGSNIQREQPIAAHRVRKATLNMAKVAAINPVDFTFYFDVAEKAIVHPYEMVDLLCQVVKGLADISKNELPQDIKAQLKDTKVSEQAKAIVDLLHSGEKRLILLGAVAQNHPQAANINKLSKVIAQLADANIGYLTYGCNTSGAWIAGAVPHRTAGGQEVSKPGLDAQAMLAKPRKAYILLGLEPELDCANATLVREGLANADVVIALSAYQSEFLREFVDVLLPIVPFTETAGTFINVCGQWQNFQPTTQSYGQARPGWKVLRVLGNFLKLDGFDYLSADEILSELKQQIKDKPTAKIVAEEFTLNSQKQNAQLTRITEWPLYRTDSIVRRSEPLQQAATKDVCEIVINQATAAKLQLKHGDKAEVFQGDGTAILPVNISERVPDQCVMVPAGYNETAGLGESFGTIEVKQYHD